MKLFHRQGHWKADAQKQFQKTGRCACGRTLRSIKPERDGCLGVSHWKSQQKLAVPTNDAKTFTDYRRPVFHSDKKPPQRRSWLWRKLFGWAWHAKHT